MIKDDQWRAGYSKVSIPKVKWVKIDVKVKVCLQGIEFKTYLNKLKKKKVLGKSIWTNSSQKKEKEEVSSFSFFWLKNEWIT